MEGFNSGVKRLNGRCESNDGQNFQVVMVGSCSYHVLGFDTAVFRLVLVLQRYVLPSSSGDSWPFKMSVSTYNTVWC
jgi:hypothetical protein